MTDWPLHRLAVVAVVLTSVLNSFGGVLVRSLEQATPWQLICYRAGATASTLAIIYIVQTRGAALRTILSITPWGLLGAVFLASAQSSFIFSLTHTTVANTLFVLSGMPFFTAILAWVVLGERVRRVTWIAIAVAMCGIAIMLWDSIGAGTMLGNVFALVTSVSFSAYIVILRLGRAANMLPVVVLGASLACLGGAVFSGLDLDVPPGDVGIALAWGIGISGLAHLLFTFGSRHVAGAELTLLMLVEFILGPLWVWWLFDERASGLTLVGGLLVMAAVVSRGLAGIAPKRRTPLA
ncbi:MAG: DMT family transporter [Ectothiorhodospiraceae bacterium]|nr:DMT family transporter [Ectothiorhodospiraceae bacterium]